MARRLLLKEGGLDGVEQAPNGFKYIGFSGATFSIKNETGETDQVSGPSDSNSFYIGINFIELEEFVYIAPEKFKILDIDLNFFGDPSEITISILVNNSNYSIGDNISDFDEVKITINQVGFIKLNCEKI
jgi:hypothetical protein